MIFPAAGDSNPERVTYQLYDSTLGLYINPATGEASSDTYWFLKSEFDTVNYTVTPNSYHDLYVRSRNSDSLKTDWSLNNALYSWASIPEIDSVAADSPDSIFIRINPQNNPSYTYFALEDSITGLFYNLDSLRFQSTGVTEDSSWAWYTFAEWGGLSGTYIHASSRSSLRLRLYSKDGKTRQ